MRCARGYEQGSVRSQIGKVPVSFATVAIVFAIVSAIARAEDHAQWIEEPGATALDAKHSPTHSYLDPSTVQKGDDGLVYFTESADVANPKDVGKIGIMKNAYDCAHDIKYMCIGHSDWKNDLSSTTHTKDDPALPIYRKYLCGDGATDSKR